jgi:hypothetical protein
VVRIFNTRHWEQRYDLDESESLLTDLLSDLKHFARIRYRTKQASVWSLPQVYLVLVPELEGLIKDLREFAEEHDLCWQASHDSSNMHFEAEVAEEISDWIETCGVSWYRITQETGITELTLTRFISGQGGLTMKALDFLAELLRLSIATGKTKGRNWW